MHKLHKSFCRNELKIGEKLAFGTILEYLLPLARENVNTEIGEKKIKKIAEIG